MITTYEENFCINTKHELFIDNKYFIPIIKDILKEIQKSKTVNREKYREKHNFVQWELNKDDLQTYWSQFIKNVPKSSMILWDMLDKEIRKYQRILVGK